MPGLNKLDNALRWGFIKKVYGIISAQLLLTVAVASLILFNEPVGHFVTTSGPFQITVFLLSFIGNVSQDTISTPHGSTELVAEHDSLCMQA